MIHSIPQQPDPDWKQISAIEICDNAEPLVPVSLAPGKLKCYPAYYKLGIPNAIPECHVRKGVYLRLLQAAELLPEGISLLVLDSWRPYAVQQYLYDTLYNAIETRWPDKSPTALEQLTREFVSLPSTHPQTPSPHLTGGSVDVTLIDEQGLMLDMGTLFDEASSGSHSGAFELLENPTPHEQQIIGHRRLLYRVMTAAGFTNLPSEWWHYDFGNQLWAWYSNSTQACYGVAQPDNLESRWRKELDSQKD
ncbi:M15 family metallopeptidase [Oceanisphaera psychrotolerans]|uniref:D-alanyl-D-alanine dipeptidase n=1 Tax=Oceanisphaera psychrotolerans TaxID=1414654 RepID=A0A1J4QD44_9GAMM|nr:M15 family metallopeptidase [Oceanisphaera psychrotolerans]OIN08847.1 D-alanyl-D-alanine dipeptidase [Oceanisphaera psychrotolerans]